MATLGDLVLRVSASSVEFDKGLDRASQKAKQFSSGAGSMLANPYLASAAAAIGGAASIGAFAASLRETASEMVKLTHEAQKLGVSTEQLSGLQHAAEISGVEFGTLTSALEKLQHRLAGTGESGNEAQTAITALGLNFQAFKTLDPATQFQEIAQAIASLPTANDQISATFAIFGREGGGLVSLLQKGGAGIRDLMNEAKALGLTFDALDAGKVEKANAAILRLGSVWDGIKRSLVVEGAPVVEGVATAFTDAVKEAGGFRTVFAGMVEVVTHGLIAISGVLDEIITKSDRWSKKSSDIGNKINDLLHKGQIDSIEIGGFHPVGFLPGAADLSDWIRGKLFEDDNQGGQLNNPVLNKFKQFLEDFKKKAAEAADAASNLGNGFDKLNERAKLISSIDDLNKKLQEQVDTFGMSAAQIEIWKLAQKGAEDVTLNTARSLADQLKRLEDVKKITEDTKTPLATFADQFSRINDLLDEGAISADVAGAAIGKAFEALDSSSKATEFHAPAALEAGSRDAISAVLRAQRTDTAETVQERIERVLKQQKDVQDKQAELQKQMLAALQNVPIKQLAL